MIENCYWQNRDPGRQSLNYLKFTPEGYDAESGRLWPLIVFLHGSGERGDDIDAVRRNGPFRFENSREVQPELPFFMVAPQCPENKIWLSFTESLNEFLDDMLKEMPVDPQRVYLTGLSMGGTGSWHWALSNPGRFAAVAPVCGTGIGWYGGALADVPVWAFHGDADDVIPLSESETMVESINKRGGDAKLTVYPGVGHGCFMQVYADQALYDWFLEQQKQ